MFFIFFGAFSPKKSKSQKLCHCSPILAIHPSTRGIHDLWKVSFSFSQTDRQTDRYGDFMTESAQWANSVKIAAKKPRSTHQLYILV